MSDMTDAASKGKKGNFLTDIIEADRAKGRNQGQVVTRFPPEPNGFLHIGHSKSILLNSGLAQQFQGTFHLRFDDTNPTTEDTLYVESIQADVRWLGGEWGTHLHFASDYFPRMYELAERLVREGLAYVDSQNVEAIREGRGSFEKPGVDSPFRTRSVEENLTLLGRMRAGEMKDGEAVLRAKIDMSHPNVLMRDPLMYRIRHAHHHRTGDSWCIYPMYDFAHPLEDAFEGVTHSICTLEFESNRELYDWVLDHLGPWEPRPRQYEFARLALGYTVMSKRKLLQLVQEKRVSGWGRSAHADGRGDAPAWRDARGSARFRRTNRRRQEQQPGGHRQARVLHPQRPRAAGAAGAGGARSAPLDGDQLARGEDGDALAPVVAG